MASSFLDQYESLDVIGNGAFGIIRKVRRKADGSIFARKELKFEKMQERDRKQIVAEVNILKELHHDHIVKYHDRYVDKDAGILYILMEFCGGGDLSMVIQQAQKHNRPIPEDTIWNYFMQILLALQHCHHPNGHGRNGSGGSGTAGGFESEGRERRNQILHRDLKPDNVFLDESNAVKLGDFGLSKALLQTNFANTYVGTPYYMSPEVMQEKAYDSKSDIWSLGCLIYELCAHKPPFHEAKSHSELNILVRNGRIPPLPKGYSQSLAGVIKAMLNLNPAMRPSAAQLLQHERLELVFKVSETEKMLATVKSHKSAVIARERELAAREAAFSEREQQLAALVAQKDSELASLHQTIACHPFSQQDLETAVREAISRREEELRILVLQREEEVAAAMAKREEEIIVSVNKREAELNEAWVIREEQIRCEVDERVKWIQDREADLAAEQSRLEQLNLDLEEKAKKWEGKSVRGRKEKGPLEEVKNLLEPLTRASPPQQENKTPTVVETHRVRSPSPFPGLTTPAARPVGKFFNPTPASAMKGVVLTSTGEILATPASGDLAKLFVESPKVGLNFTKIFDPNAKKTSEPLFRDADEVEDSADEAESPPPSPSCRKVKKNGNTSSSDRSVSPSKRSAASSSSALPPTRIRRPSIRSLASRPNLPASISSSVSDPNNLTGSGQPPKPLPLPHPHLHNHSNSVSSLPNTRAVTPGSSTRAMRTNSAPAAASAPAEYDLLDEENLPSPFLKRGDRGVARSGSVGKRHSNGNLLRAVAAANASARKTNGSITGMAEFGGAVTGAVRPSVTSARRAGEDSRKALSRQS